MPADGTPDDPLGRLGARDRPCGFRGFEQRVRTGGSGEPSPPSVSGGARRASSSRRESGAVGHSSHATFGYQWRRCLADGTDASTSQGRPTTSTRRGQTTSVTRCASRSRRRTRTDPPLRPPPHRRRRGADRQAPHNGALPDDLGLPVVGRCRDRHVGHAGRAPPRSASPTGGVDVAVRRRLRRPPRHPSPTGSSSADLGQTSAYSSRQGRAAAASSACRPDRSGREACRRPQPPQDRRDADGSPGPPSRVSSSGATVGAGRTHRPRTDTRGSAATGPEATAA